MPTGPRAVMQLTSHTQPTCWKEIRLLQLNHKQIDHTVQINMNRAGIHTQRASSLILYNDSRSFLVSIDTFSYTKQHQECQTVLRVGHVCGAVTWPVVLAQLVMSHGAANAHMSRKNTGTMLWMPQSVAPRTSGFRPFFVSETS